MRSSKCWWIILIIVFNFIFSCSKKGEPGPQGSKGDQGERGPEAIILDFKYIHSHKNLGANFDLQLFKEQGGITKFYNRDTDGIMIYMKAGAINNTTRNFTLVPLPFLLKDSIKFDFMIKQPDPFVPDDNPVFLFCYVPVKNQISSTFQLSGHYPFGTRDTSFFYRAIIFKGQKAIISNE